MKRWIAIFCLMLFACGLCACAADAEMSAENTSADAVMDEAAALAAESSSTGSSPLLDDRKLVRSASMSIEALDFDAVCASLLQLTEDLKGYVASADVTTPSYDDARRSAFYELRIPSERYNDFLSGAESSGNVTNLQESVEDITNQYVDVEARLESLQAQQERLYELLEQAQDIETVLAIQNQLTEIQYQIESYTAQQRSYDQQVSYSSIRVYVDEVARVTEKQDTFMQKLGAAFSGSWRLFGEVLQTLILALVTGFPFVLLGIFCLVLTIVLLRRKKQKKQPSSPPDSDTQGNT